jgi:hypothetical protein
MGLGVFCCLFQTNCLPGQLAYVAYRGQANVAGLARAEKPQQSTAIDGRAGKD